MREIHAYQNDDGTYRVEIMGPVKSSRLQQGKGWVDNISQSTTEIPRAKISLTCLSPTSEDVAELFTIIIPKGEFNND